MIANLLIPLSLMFMYGHFLDPYDVWLYDDNMTMSGDEDTLFLPKPLKFEGIDYNNPETTHNDTFTLMSSCTGEYLRCLSFSIKIAKVCYMDVRDMRMKTASDICDLDLINCNYIRENYPKDNLTSTMNVALYEGDGSCEQSGQKYRHEVPAEYKFRTRPPMRTRPSTTPKPTSPTTTITTTIPTTTKRTKRPWFPWLRRTKATTTTVFGQTTPTPKTKRPWFPWLRRTKATTTTVFGQTTPTPTTKARWLGWFFKTKPTTIAGQTLPPPKTKGPWFPWLPRPFKRKTKPTTTPTTTISTTTEQDTGGTYRFHDWCKLSRYTYDQDSGLCYRISKKRATWHEAVGACDKDRKGSYLAVIRSEEERNVLAKLLNDVGVNITAFNYGYYWVGAWCPTCTTNMTVEEMKFVTIFNEPLAEVGFDRWGDNEPNNPTFQHCVSVYAAVEKQPEQRALLHNQQCNSALYYVCQRKRN